MRNTITVRVDDSLREALERQAEASGLTLSDLIREALRDTFQQRSLKERVGHLRGALSWDVSEEEPLVRELRKRNWRP